LPKTDVSADRRTTFILVTFASYEAGSDHVDAFRDALR
jgi:hypothetical protein